MLTPAPSPVWLFGMKPWKLPTKDDGQLTQGLLLVELLTFILPRTPELLGTELAFQ